MSNPETIHKQFIEKEITLAFAESCTGGHLSAMMTSLPDASKYFLGSFITYANSLKQTLLNVSQKTLIDHGSVSRETANEMLLGLMKKTEADFGVAITGIAGPSGGTKEKPVGTVYIAIGERGKKPHVIKCKFEGSRKNIIESTCSKALHELEGLIQ